MFSVGVPCACSSVLALSGGIPRDFTGLEPYKSNHAILILNLLKRDFRKELRLFRSTGLCDLTATYLSNINFSLRVLPCSQAFLSFQIQGTSTDLVHGLMGAWNCYMLFSGGRQYILFSISMCFSGRGSSILVKSAMMLDLEFQHGI